MTTKSRALTRLTVGILGLWLLSACGTGTPAGSATSVASPVTPSQIVPATPTPTPPLTPASAAMNAVEVAKAVAGEERMQVWQSTEDNDSNGLLGRLNGYIDGAVAQLLNLTGTCDAATPGVDCGLTIEVWKDAQGALRRGQYIQTVLKGGGLGNEYDFVNGSVLLRISGEVKPSAAQKINSRFSGTAVDAPA